MAMGRWTTRNNEKRREIDEEISNLQDKLRQPDLSSKAINEISEMISSKRTERKRIDEDKSGDFGYMKYG